MRQLILNRIEEIRKLENNFQKTSVKWCIFTCGQNKIHISLYDFNDCDDVELLKIFEKIIKNK